MSRSYRKVASVSTNSKGMKRIANQKIRRTRDIHNGSHYRKVYCSWDINDQGSAVTYRDDHLERWLSHSPEHRLYMK